MKITITLPTPRGSQPGSTDYVQVARIMEALRKSIQYGGAWGVDTSIVEMFKNAKVEKSL